MILKSIRFLLSVFLVFAVVSFSYSQDTRDYDKLESTDENDISYYKKEFSQLVFFDYRGTNIFEAAGGIAMLLDDIDNKENSFYYRLGYKRAVTDHLLLGLSYNNYELSYNNIEQSLASFDFNIEFLLLPYNKFSPFLYGGFGYNALDDFEVSAVKLQGGFGLEVIVIDKLGIKLFAEYNYSLDDEMEFLINDQEDDSFLRLGLGVNLYFGGETQREKRLENIPTKIKTNSIGPEDY